MRRVSIVHAVVLAVAILAAAFIFARIFFNTSQRPAENFSKEYSLVLSDFKGQDVHLYSYRGQIVVAYAWASWCVYCGTELQSLAELKKTYGDKVQIIAINRGEPESIAKDFIAKLGLGNNVTLLLDPTDSFFKSIEGYAMPETVFIDTSGNVVYHQRGPLDKQAMETRMKELIH
jgi:thiol-disulfide isomerase/thioredoxin